MTQSFSNSETFLRKFHAQYAGVSPKVFLNARTSEGGSSYELLAQLIPHGEQELTVVDLACGDGPLLELLLKRNQSHLRLIGVDMSPDELDLARRRLAANKVDLRLERAQQLSLAENSVDYILCHFAFMLMDPVEDVVSEIHRVLRPGGLFAAIVVGELVHGDAFAAFTSVTREIIVQEGAGAAASLGDRRTSSAEGLESLFHAGSGFDEPIITKNSVMHLDGLIERVRENLFSMYNVAMISPSGLETLNTRTTEILKSFQRPDGIVPCSLGLRLILCKKKADCHSAPNTT